MHVKLQRYSRGTDLVIGTSTATSTTVRAGDLAGAAVLIQGHTSTATITIWGSADNATYGQLVTGGAVATITLPASGAVIDMPGDLFGARFVRLVSSIELPGMSAVMMGKA